MTANLLRKINDLVGDVNYIPYNITDTVVLLGTPQVPITGMEYVFARHDAPQTIMVKSLNGKSVFVDNNNKTGTIEFGLLAGTLANGQIEILNLTGIPFPINIVDTKTGGTSRVLGTACKLVATPEWRREALPGINIYTFQCTRLSISHGIRLSE